MLEIERRFSFSSLRRGGMNRTALGRGDEQSGIHAVERSTSSDNMLRKATKTYEEHQMMKEPTNETIKNNVHCVKFVFLLLNDVKRYASNQILSVSKDYDCEKDVKPNASKKRCNLQ